MWFNLGVLLLILAMTGTMVTAQKKNPGTRMVTRAETMAANDSIVFPDELESIQNDLKETESVITEVNNNSLEAPSEEQPEIGLRNMIVVPDNCPKGYVRGPDGVCREDLDM